MVAFRRAVLVVALMNLAYGMVEFTVSRAIGSVSLMADSIDFAEDAALNLLVFWAATWPVRQRARAGSALAVVIAVPALATLVTAVLKWTDPARPSPHPMWVTGVGALIVNLACAAILVRHRTASGSLAKAAWFSARNDAVANLAVLAAVGVGLVWVSGWPDLVVGLGIGVLNADAAVKVWRAARREVPAAQPEA